MPTALFLWLQRIGTIAILCIALLHAAFRIQAIPDDRVDLGGAEINLVYGTQKLLLGRPLYENPEQPPFDVMQYTPLYYHSCAWIASMLAIDPHDTRMLYRVGRVYSLLLNVLLCVLVVGLCRSLEVDRWLSIAMASIGFCLLTEHFYARTDALYIVFFAAALLTHVRWTIGTRSYRTLLWTALLSSLCLLSKQSGVLIIGTIWLHLLAMRKWREAALYVLAVLIFFLLGMSFFLQDGSWHHFYQNTVQGIANGMTRTMYIELFDPPTYKYYILFHFVGAGLIVHGLRSGRAHTDRFLSLAIATTFAFGFITGLKHGSNINYLYEAHLLVLIGAARWVSNVSPVRASWAALAMLLFGVLFTTYRTRSLVARSGSEQQRIQANIAYRADLRVRDVLVNELGLLPSQKVFITYRGHLELLLNGQVSLPQKDIIEWSTKPLFNYEHFHRSMIDGSVRFVISDKPLDTLHFLGTTYGPYRTVRSVDGRSVLAPSGR